MQECKTCPQVAKSVRCVSAETVKKFKLLSLPVFLNSAQPPGLSALLPRWPPLIPSLLYVPHPIQAYLSPNNLSPIVVLTPMLQVLMYPEHVFQLKSPLLIQLSFIMFTSQSFFLTSDSYIKLL